MHSSADVILMDLNIGEAKTKIESALDDVTKVAAAKDTDRLRIDSSRLVSI